jgi:release factor glutamine methyltransferase
MDQATFCGLPLLTAPGKVMTPRAATEQLVAEALELIGDRPARVADVGTGSGAIAIAIASAAPQAVVWATDTSRLAVALARANVLRHGLRRRVVVSHGDLLDSVPTPIDLVVANLPYLPAFESPFHPDLAAEPHPAVFAPGDGLDPYRRLLAASSRQLTADGAVVLQFRRRVHTASRENLSSLLAEIERARPALPLQPTPQVAGAVG